MQKELKLLLIDPSPSASMPVKSLFGYLVYYFPFLKSLIFFSFSILARFPSEEESQRRRELHGRSSVIDGLEFSAMADGVGAGENDVFVGGESTTLSSSFLKLFAYFFNLLSWFGNVIDWIFAHNACNIDTSLSLFPEHCERENTWL